MSFEYKTDVQEHQGEATKAKVRRNVTKNKRQQAGWNVQAINVEI